MLDRILIMMIDTNLLLFGGLVLVLLYAANEIGFRAGLWRARHRPPQDRDLAGIGTITAGMPGLLAFSLSLTINIAQNRFELRSPRRWREIPVSRRRNLPTYRSPVQASRKALDSEISGDVA